ncbi:hypothetical protein Tco_1261185, partial [Tanacetum coccineum]
VMSTPAYAQLIDTNTESDPEKAPSEAEELLPLGSRVPLMSKGFEASKPSSTRTVSSYSLVSSHSTTPLSPDHPLTHVSPTPTPTRVSFHHRTAHMAVHTQPTLSPGMLARIAEAAALSLSSFHKRYRSYYKTPSPSSYLTLLVRKRYRGTSELILDTNSEGDELGKEDTEEDKEDETASEPLGLGYGAARRHALESIEEIVSSTYEVGRSSRVYTNIPTYVPPTTPIQTPPSPEWLLGSLPVSPSSSVVPSHIALPVATSTATILVDEDQFLEVGAQLELHGSIIYDHTLCLDALPPALFEGYDRDLRELYTRLGARPVLALEAWVGQTDAQRAALWHAIYDIQKENYDLRR